MKKFAFTLAEVITVVGLLGVIAALTIPNLYYNKTQREYATKIKKFYNVVDNAVEQMTLDKGDFRNMRPPMSNREGYEWYMENIDPYVGHKYIKNPDSQQPIIYLKEGSSIQLFRGGCIDVKYDVNGDNGNGMAGREEFLFLFCFTDNDRNYWFGDKNSFWGTYGGGIVSTDADGNYKKVKRQDLINKCDDDKAYCSKLLQYDNWEFKDDYPAFR